MLLKTDGRYKAIRERCNGHMHYRDFKAVLLNDTDVYVDRSPILDQLEGDVIDLFVMHLACIFFMNDHYMMSSDYFDYLECGMEPEEDSQYWVADFVQRNSSTKYEGAATRHLRRNQGPNVNAFGLIFQIVVAVVNIIASLF